MLLELDDELLPLELDDALLLELVESLLLSLSLEDELAGRGGGGGGGARYETEETVESAMSRRP